MIRFITFLALGLTATLTRAADPSATGRTAAHTYPYSMTGQLTFDSGSSSYLGSGTVVQPRGVLTAGHNLYDTNSGWSTDLVFRRGHYNATNLAVRSPSQLFILAGYQSQAARSGGDNEAAFAKDIGGLFFSSRLAGGNYLGWTPDASTLGTNLPKVGLGYGAEEHSGEELLAVKPPRPFFQVYKSFYEGAGTRVEGGMSGGPLIVTTADGRQLICGVIVSGVDFPVYGGIRAINNGVSKFIFTYLAEPK